MGKKGEWDVVRQASIYSIVVNILLLFFLISNCILLLAFVFVTAIGAVVFIGNRQQVFINVINVVGEQYAEVKPDFDDSAWSEPYNDLLQFYCIILMSCGAVLVFIHFVVIVAFLMRYLSFRFVSVLLILLAALAEMAASVYISISSNELKAGITEYLLDIQPKFTGANATNFESLLINYVQQAYKCCGVRAYVEWTNPTYTWERTVTYGNITHQIQYPISCCEGLVKTQVPDCAFSTGKQLPFTRGCANELTDHIFSRTNLPLPMLPVPYFVVHCFLLVLATVILFLEQKKKRLQNFAEIKITPTDEVNVDEEQIDDPMMET